MTEMRRVTVAIPDRLDSRILQLRKTTVFAKCSYSELVRMLLDVGLDAMIQSNQG
jgi:Arc/MetJ-type ribon-helix-helix transcriptional regulator